jgi:hypothetical protein
MVQGVKRTAVYTAIFGDYDDLKPPSLQDSDCDFYCFTDSALPPRVGLWRVIHVPTDPSLHPRMQAKWYKIMSHESFANGRVYGHRSIIPFFAKKYDATVWCDASLEIKGPSFVRAVVEKLTDNSIVLFEHPDRDCIFEEAGVSAGMFKYIGLPLREQAESYRAVGVSEHGGLYACGMLGRKTIGQKKIERLNSIWFNENIRWTYQDQLSFPVALKLSGAVAVLMSGNLWKNDFFDHIGHKSEA